MQLSHNGLEDDHRKPLTNRFGQAVGQLFLFSGPEKSCQQQCIRTILVQCWAFTSEREGDCYSIALGLLEMGVESIEGVGTFEQ